MRKGMLAGGVVSVAALVTLFSVALNDTDDDQHKSDKPATASPLTYREVGLAAQNYPDFQGKSIGESSELPVRQGDWATTVIQVGIDDPQTSSTSRVLLRYVDGAWKMVASDDARRFCSEVPDKIKAAMSCP